MSETSPAYQVAHAPQLGEDLAAEFWRRLAQDRLAVIRRARRFLAFGEPQAAAIVLDAELSLDDLPFAEERE